MTNGFCMYSGVFSKYKKYFLYRQSENTKTFYFLSEYNNICFVLLLLVKFSAVYLKLYLYIYIF